MGSQLETATSPIEHEEEKQEKHQLCVILKTWRYRNYERNVESTECDVFTAHILAAEVWELTKGE